LPCSRLSEQDACLLRPSGYRRCASFALPSASVGMAQRYDFYPFRALPSSPRTTAQTAWRISASFLSVMWPATRRTMLLLAVTSLCGKRKLCFGNPPAKKSDSWIGIAFLCVRGWLVIWQSSTSPRSNTARTRAGRTFWLLKSVNGNGTVTASPATSPSMPRPPRPRSNQRPTPFEPEAAWNPPFQFRQTVGFSRTSKNPKPRAGFPPGRFRFPRARFASSLMCFNAYRHGFPAEFEPGKVSGRCRANGNANVPVGFARHVTGPRRTSAFLKERRFRKPLL